MLCESTVTFHFQVLVRPDQTSRIRREHSSNWATAVVSSELEVLLPLITLHRCLFCLFCHVLLLYPLLVSFLYCYWVTGPCIVLYCYWVTGTLPTTNHRSYDQFGAHKLDTKMHIKYIEYYKCLVLIYLKMKCFDISCTFINILVLLNYVFLISAPSSDNGTFNPIL